jgi:hypothetical protein
MPEKSLAFDGAVFHVNINGKIHKYSFKILEL